MPYVATDGGRHFDFEVLHFSSANTEDIDATIRAFFAKYPQIVGNKEYITYRLRRRVEEERAQLRQLQANSGNTLVAGVRVFVQHDVIPAENGGRENYVYALQIAVQAAAACVASTKLSLNN